MLRENISSKVKVKAQASEIPLIQLRVRTEYSFRYAFGHAERIVQACSNSAIGITDRSGTWGHVSWNRLCKKQGIKPIFGVELAVVRDATVQEKQPLSWMTFLAATDEGLKEIYELTSDATSHFYYVPRLSYYQLRNLSQEVVVLIGANAQLKLIPKRKNFCLDLTPMTPQQHLVWAHENKIRIIAACDNLYPNAADRIPYEVIVSNLREQRTSPGHLLTRWEWIQYWPEEEEAIQETARLAKELNAVLPEGEMVHPKIDRTLEQQCRQAAKRHRINLKDPIYKDRLKRELDLIEEKQFQDYFYVIADLCQFARQHMFVGPARGSSCGSLVCYLLDITEIDPIKYDLLFERFIDVNRTDLPDIDIDFPEDKRDMIFDYLREKYGQDCVARLGTISRYKAKSTLTDVAKVLNIPQWELVDLKNSIIERSGGDSRASFCILDSFTELEIGRKFIAKYPQLKIAADIEAHARHSGQHAAGVIVTARPVTYYCSVDQKNGCAQIDKYDAEPLNLLKIDALGLRTLSVIEDCLEQISWTRQRLLQIEPNDPKAFAVLNDCRFAGIFQFEGYALQSLCRQMKVDQFEDMVSLTALARPGPLISGGAEEYIQRRLGKKESKAYHPLIREITEVTYGVVIYQEQVMSIARKMGQLNWEDVSSLRKAMSKSLGKEFFDQYWKKFREGAAQQGIQEEDAHRIWESITTFGSWAFNRSHAVAYGMVSYYCCLLKAHFPLEFASANLRHAKDAAQCVKLLRELVKEGYTYKPFDADHSEMNWTVQNGVLIGGLTSIIGIGESKAQNILERKSQGTALTPQQQKFLQEGKTPWDQLFEAHNLWGSIYDEPARYRVTCRIWDIGDLTEECDGMYVFIGKMTEKNLGNLNELINIQKRGGVVMEGQTRYLNLFFEDDTGNIAATIGSRSFLKWGEPIVEERKIGDWFLVKGQMRRGIRKVYISKVKHLTTEFLEESNPDTVEPG